MRSIAYLIPLIFSGCLSTGCAAWLGKDEPGIRFKLIPGIVPRVEFEHTADASVKWDQLTARHGENALELSGLEYSHDATSVREVNVLQMQQAVESQRIATEAITNVFNGILQAIPGLIQSVGQQRAASDASDLELLRVRLEAIERLLRPGPQPPPLDLELPEP